LASPDPAAASPLTGAHALTQALARAGVTTVFGYPGGAALPIYEALAKSHIRHVLVRHETAAAHAADGYARSTGRVGVCLATSGPGVTNLITGLLTAQMDGVPVLAITGQVASSALGTDAFQEADTPSLLLAASKAVLRPRTAAEVGPLTAYALRLARMGRAGVVVLDMPKDVASSPVAPGPVRPVRDRPRAAVPPPDPHVAQRVREALLSSRRPLVMVGHGAQGSAAAVRRLLARLGVPSVSTLLGLGTVPHGFPGYLGMVGMHGTREANLATLEADFLLALGARLDDRVTGDPRRFMSQAVIAQVDAEAAHLRRLVKVDLPVHAEVGAFLHLWSQTPWPERGTLPWGGEPWAQPGTFPPAEEEGDGAQAMSARTAFAYLREAIDPRAFVVTDVGQHQMWAALYLPVREARGFVTSGGLGTMGFGLPAALGVKAAHPDREVWLVSGDGSFVMTAHEMATAVTEGLGVRMVVLDNAGLGMVRQWQELFYPSGPYQVELGDVPDLLKLADAYGVPAYRASSPGELREALARARTSSGPCLVHVRIRQDEHVYPMIPPGQSAAEMLVAPPSP
jgi:acetolactate synthase-1/2/3 large subunit